jgi:Transposase DDE domain
MKKQTVSAQDLLNLIPCDLLERVGNETGVNYQVKKLRGEFMFKLLLFGLTTRKELSWRIIEFMLNNYKFRQFASVGADFVTDHSSLAARMSSIPPEYFKQILASLSQEVSARYPTERIGGYKLTRFDSTLVSIAGTLLKTAGLRHGVNKSKSKASDRLDIKFTIGFDGLTGAEAVMFNRQTYLSEDIALKEVILGYNFGKDEIAVFDRGLNGRKTFDALSERSLMFVTRLKATKGMVKHQVVRQITEIADENFIETDKLIVVADEEVYLYHKNAKTKHTYRLITTVSKHSGEILYFLTNEKDLSVEQVLHIYARRWDIEVFFKFLKQEFGLKHLLSRNENGIKVMLFMILIAFTLIFLYYKLNKITGLKIAKIQFAHEIEFDILKAVVEMCNGDPNLLYLLSPT